MIGLKFIFFYSVDDTISLSPFNALQHYMAKLKLRIRTEVLCVANTIKEYNLYFFYKLL